MTDVTGRLDTDPLEALLTTEVARMYEEVANNPHGEFHFYTGREAALMYGYQSTDLDAVPQAVISRASAGPSTSPSVVRAES